MTDIDRLRDQLGRLGEHPAPPPRPEFADALLERILERQPEVLPPPTPLRPERQRSKLPTRVVAIGSIAAALIAVVGLVGLLDEDSSRQEIVFAGDSTERVEVPSDGSLDTKAVHAPDGWHEATCVSGGHFSVGGRDYRCEDGETLRVLVASGRIVEVGLDHDDDQVSGAPTTTTPATAEGPNGTTTTSAPQQPAAPTSPTRIELEREVEVGDSQVGFRWARYTGADFARYVLLRSTGDTIAWPASGDTVVLWSSTSRDVVAHVDASLPEAEEVRYQLVVVDAGDTILAHSDVTRIALAAKTPAAPVTTPAAAGD